MASFLSVRWVGNEQQEDEGVEAEGYGSRRVLDQED